MFIHMSCNWSFYWWARSPRCSYICPVIGHFTGGVVDLDFHTYAL